MRSLRLGSNLAPLLAASCWAGLATPATAQDNLTEDTIDQAQTVQPAEAAESGDDAAPMAGKSDLVIAPIPISNPSLGTGLAVAGILYYNPNAGPQPWSTGAGAGYLSSKSWFVGGFHKMSLDDDRFRGNVVGGYAQANVDFYGIGPDAGKAGLSVELHNKVFGGYVDGQYQPFTKGFLRHFHIGARVTFTDNTATLEIPVDKLPPVLASIVPPSIERNSQVVLLGPSFTYDSLNLPMNPTKGVFVEGRLLYGTGWLGSDYTHHRFELAANGFFQLHEGTVLAIRRQLCSTSKSTPYYDLCLFGRGPDLRGYEAGRYRDRASWAIQAELRQHVAGRFGAVGFFGVGGIAPSGGDILKHSTVLVAGGVGARYLASESANVNLRADIAYGKDGFAFYFGVGEAF